MIQTLKEVSKEMEHPNGVNEYTFFSPRGIEFVNVHKYYLNAYIQKKDTKI